MRERERERERERGEGEREMEVEWTHLLLGKSEPLAVRDRRGGGSSGLHRNDSCGQRMHVSLQQEERLGRGRMAGRKGNLLVRRRSEDRAGSGWCSRMILF